jgi:uncharacterized protein (TIGR02118 family)
MIRVTVSYPNAPGARFDFDYYVKHHMALVQEKLGPLGLKRGSAWKAIGGMPPGSTPELLVQASLDFETVEQMQAAMLAESATLLADLKNFTDIRPVIQINEVLM